MLSPPTDDDAAAAATTTPAGHAAFPNAGIIVDDPLGLLLGLAPPHLLQTGLELGRGALLLLHHLGPAAAGATGPTASGPKREGRGRHGRRRHATRIVVVATLSVIIQGIFDIAFLRRRGGGGKYFVGGRGC